jgi:hypothetical protein
VSNIGRPEIAAIADWLIDGARSAAAPQQVLPTAEDRPYAGAARSGCRFRRTSEPYPVRSDR